MPEALTGNAIRRIVLEQSFRANVGHIGSALSVADLMAAIFGGRIRIAAPEDPDRDRFVLSKGHAALSFYAVLALLGWIDPASLDRYCANDSPLGVHPEHDVRGIDFSTGSLGQGITFGVGAALGGRLQHSKRRVFVMVSDAECNEGSTWEAVMFAAQNQLSNLIVIVDLNGQQAFGYTRDVIDASNMAERFSAFGWDAHDVDGHDVAALAERIESFDTVSSGRPHVIVAQTTFGKGVSYMENQIPWHYLPMSNEQFSTAIGELEARA